MQTLSRMPRMINAECPACGVIQELPDNAAGCVGTCECGRKFRIKGGPGAAPSGNELGGVNKAGCAPMLVEAIFTFFSGGVLGGLGKGISKKKWGSLLLSVCVFSGLLIFTLIVGGWMWPIFFTVWGIFVFVKFFFDFIGSAA